jgi:hypothetical protein
VTGVIVVFRRRKRLRMSEHYAAGKYHDVGEVVIFLAVY